MTDHYDQLYATKYAAKDYVERVKRTVGLLKAKYGLAARERRQQPQPTGYAATGRSRESIDVRLLSRDSAGAAPGSRQLARPDDLVTLATVTRK